MDKLSKVIDTFQLSELKRFVNDFFKDSHHPGGSLIYRAHVTFLTCKANLESANTSRT